MPLGHVRRVRCLRKASGLIAQVRVSSLERSPRDAPAGLRNPVIRHGSDAGREATAPAFPAVIQAWSFRLQSSQRAATP